VAKPALAPESPPESCRMYRVEGEGYRGDSNLQKEGDDDHDCFRHSIEAVVDKEHVAWNGPAQADRSDNGSSED